MKKILSFALLATLAVGGNVALAAEQSASLPAGCEPGTALDLRARVLEIIDQGASVRVTVEVTLDATMDLRSARIRGNGVNRLFGASDERLARRNEGTLTALRQTARMAPSRVTRYPIDLAKGKVHQLMFKAEVETSNGEPLTARAHVTVNLDPDQQAEQLPGLVQYRARSSR